MSDRSNVAIFNNERLSVEADRFNGPAVDNFREGLVDWAGAAGLSQRAMRKIARHERTTAAVTPEVFAGQKVRVLWPLQGKSGSGSNLTTKAG